MDDLIIISKDEQEGLDKLRKVLDAAMRIKWEKCQVLQKMVQFLGYVVENATIQPSAEKTCAVQNFPVPRGLSSTVSWPNILFPKVCERLRYYCQTFVELA